MPGPFAITAASNTIVLDNRRQGQASFTVTNASGRPLRGRARLVPQDPATGSWLSMVGEVERDFTIGATQQYLVQVAVPSGTPAGNYSFRLDEVGVENPDEEFTEGPSATFAVPSSQPPVSNFPWWVLAAALAAILVIGLGTWWVLAGGDDDGNGDATVTPTQGTQSPTAAKQSPTIPPPLSEIDVMIVRMALPPQVGPGQTFSFTVEVVNSSLSGPTAGAATVEVRAKINDSLGATDVPVGSVGFQNLEPQKHQQKTVQGHAPPRKGLWTVYATLMPVDFKDTKNNTWQTTLMVVPGVD